MSFVGSRGRSNDHSSTVVIFVTELNLLLNAGRPAFGAQEETDQNSAAPPVGLQKLVVL